MSDEDSMYEGSTDSDDSRELSDVDVDELTVSLACVSDDSMDSEDEASSD